MFDAVLAANLVEAVHSIARAVQSSRLRGKFQELIPLSVRIVCKRGAGRRGDQRFEESDSRAAIGLLMQLHESEFRGSAPRDEQMELAFFGPDFGDVDVKEADRVGLELLLGGLVAFDLR